MNQDKLKEAYRIVEDCIGKNGVWAGANRYKYQCWTRDFAIAVPTLLDLGYASIVKKHLVNVFRNQNESGEIPVLFADGFIRLFLRKGLDAIKKGRMSFVFKRMIWPGLSKLSPGTRDVEALCVLAALNYSEFSSDKDFLNFYKANIENAVGYIEKKLLSEDGLSRGADWRDMLEEQLKDKTLLSNNAILYEVYRKLRRSDKAEAIKNKINELFWSGFYYKDYPETKDFDAYGQSLAILFNIVPKERYITIFKKYEEVSMPFGFRINDIFPKPTTSEEKKSIQKIIATANQFGVVWPYINAFVILALIKMGRKNVALEHWERWNKLKGFYEWYDPETGTGYGDPEQLWSACLYIKVYNILNAL